MELKSGDILLIKNDFKWNNPLTWLSAIIRLMTRSNVNHAALVLEDASGMFVMESVWPKVKRTSIDAWIKSSSRNVYVYRKRGLTPGMLARVYTSAMSLLGKPYDILNLIIHQPILILTGKWIGRTFQGDDSLVCSELIGYVYRFSVMKWYMVQPDDFMDMPEFFRAGEFKTIKGMDGFYNFVDKSE